MSQDFLARGMAAAQRRALASTQAGQGAALIGTEDGRTVTACLADLKGALTLKAFGARGDGTTSDHTALLSLSNRSDTIIVPPGNYLIDNSTVRQINYFRGRLICSPGVTFTFTDKSQRGLHFYGGSPKLSGLRLTTRDAPLSRELNAPMLCIDEASDVVIDDLEIVRSAGAGALFRLCSGFQGTNIRIRNTLADGLDFFNSSKIALTNFLSENTGDDGLAFLSYTSLAQSYDIVARNIIVKNSDTRGISVVGPERVIIDGFTVESTRGTGVIVYQDTANGLRQPGNVKISNGIIKDAGQRLVSGTYSGNRYGIEIANCGDADFLNIHIENCAASGFVSSNTQPSVLTSRNVRVKTSGDKGFHVSVPSGGAWHHDGCETIDTQGHGFNSTVAVGGIMTFGTRIVRQGAMAGGGNGVNNRAISDSIGGAVAGRSTVIIDNQAANTGYIYYNDGNGNGSVGDFDFTTSSGYYAFQQNANNIALQGIRRSKRSNQLTQVSGSIALSGTRGEQDYFTTAALTGALDIVLPTFGLWHNAEFSLSRFDTSGSYAVTFKSGSTTIAAIEAGGNPAKMVVRYDSVNNLWRKAGRYDL